MKTAVIVLVLFVAFAAAQHYPIKEVMKSVYGKCKESMKASNETMALVYKNEGHDNKDVQCFLACVLKKMRAMKNAKVNMDKLESYTRKVKGITEEKIQEFMAVMKECKVTAETSNDECKVAGAYGKCSKTKLYMSIHYDSP